MHYKYWTIAKAHLGLPTIAQSQSDLATRQGIWGQDLCELLVTAYLFTLGVSHSELCLQPARSAAAPSSPPLIKASSVGCSRGDSMLWAGTIGSCHVLCCSCTLPHCSHTLHSSAPPWQLMGWQLRWEGGTSSAAASLICVPNSTWLLWIVSCYRIPGAVFTSFTHCVQSGWSFCSSFPWLWRMKMILLCIALYCLNFLYSVGHIL